MIRRLFLAGPAVWPLWPAAGRNPAIRLTLHPVAVRAQLGRGFGAGQPTRSGIPASEEGPPVGGSGWAPHRAASRLETRRKRPRLAPAKHRRRTHSTPP